MNCQQCLDWLQEQLDGRHAVTPGEVSAHLADCAECRAQAAAAQRLLDGSRLLDAPAPPAGLSERIVTLVQHDRRRRLVRRRIVVSALALAASVVLVVAGISLAKPTPGKVDVPETPRVAEGNRPTTRPKDNEPTLRENVTHTGTLVASLGRRTVENALEQSRPLLPAVVPPELVDFRLEAPLEAPSEWREAGQSMTIGLEPVAHSARRAFELFRREVPVMGQ